MLNRVAGKSNSAPRQVADRLFVVGGVSFLLCTTDFFPFSETVGTTIQGIAIILIAISAVMRGKLIRKELRSRQAVELELKRMRGVPAVKPVANKKEFPAALYVISLLVVALGLSFIFLVPQGYQSYRVQSQSSSWPHTTGEVISAEVVVDEQGFGSDDDLVQPKVLIKYVVSGKQYVTREIHFNQSTSWRSNSNYAEAMIKKYLPGSQVPVFYNPAEPWVAVLDTSSDWFTYFIMGLGAGFVIFGIYWLWLSLRDTYFLIAIFFKELKR